MPGCCCPNFHCFTGNCRCFREKLFCSEDCSCNDCKNTEDNKDAVEARYMKYLKKKGVITRPVNGCSCKIGCATHRCSCHSNGVGCTSKCKCQDCVNPKGRRESEANTEPAQGSKDKVSNVPGKAVHTSPSRDNRGSASNKRPRNQL